MTRNLIYNSALFTLVNSLGNLGLIAFLCLFFCSASYANDQSTDEFEFKPFISKLSHKLHMNEDEVTPKSKLKQGRFVGYSHKFSRFLGVDLSFDTYLSTNQSDNSFKWIVGVVTDLFKVQYQTDQTTKREHLELISSYPINKELRLKGYVSSKQNGDEQYNDYSVGLAYSLNQSLEISAGYADLELKEVETQSNVFLNINGVF